MGTGRELAHQHPTLAGGAARRPPLESASNGTALRSRWASFIGSLVLSSAGDLTFVAQMGGAQGALVLHSRRPPVSTEAVDHARRGPNRRTAIWATMPTAPSTPTKAEPVASTGPRPGR